MAVPKHKASKARTRRRKKINRHLDAPILVACSNCGALKLPHRVCPKCGFYSGRQVLDPESLT